MVSRPHRPIARMAPVLKTQKSDNLFYGLGLDILTPVYQEVNSYAVANSNKFRKLGMREWGFCI